MSKEDSSGSMGKSARSRPPRRPGLGFLLLVITAVSPHFQSLGFLSCAVGLTPPSHVWKVLKPVA